MTRPFLWPATRPWHCGSLPFRAAPATTACRATSSWPATSAQSDSRHGRFEGGDNLGSARDTVTGRAVPRHRSLRSSVPCSCGHTSLTVGGPARELAGSALRYLKSALKYTSTSLVWPAASRSGTTIRKRCGPSMPECMPMGSERTSGTSAPGSMVVAPTTGWVGQQPSRTSMDGLPRLIGPGPVLRSRH